jgi:hypothetical protein
MAPAISQGAFDRAAPRSVAGTAADGGAACSVGCDQGGGGAGAVGPVPGVPGPRPVLPPPRPEPDTGARCPLVRALGQPGASSAPAATRALAMSSASTNRAAGSLASARRMTSSSPTGTSARRARGGTGWSSTWARISANRLPDTNGRCPATSLEQHHADTRTGRSRPSMHTVPARLLRRHVRRRADPAALLR